MIDVKELRLGNYVLDGGHIVPVNVSVIEDLLIYPHIYDPVLLTSEILTNCNFTGGYMEFNGGCMLRVDKDEEATIMGMDSATMGQSVSVPCKYLHQLQNLFFALTGKELKYHP